MAQNTPGVAARDEVVRSSRRFGRMIWKRWSGYHQRSLVETKMHCFKLLGERIIARDFDRQVAEMEIRAAILNRLNALGRPQTQRVAEPNAIKGRLLPYDQSAQKGLRVRQNKTRTASEVPVGAPRKAALQKTLDRYRTDNVPVPETILATERGTAWTEGGFRASWRKACIKAGVKGVTFHDFRGTAVMRLAIAGATVPEIATITGHKLKAVGSILDAHYMSRDRALGAAAIRKLEESNSPK